MDFTGVWLDFIGEPELTGSWMVHGNSGNGKTRFLVQLAKYMTNFGRVAYNSMEEGTALSIKSAFAAENMHEVARKIIILDNEPISELEVRLTKRHSPDIIIIDSLQYSEMNFNLYKELKERFSKKLFIYNSHADGKKPSGRVAMKIHYDAFVKIFVEGFVAFPKSRFGGNQPYIIWPEGAERYHGTIDFSNDLNK